MPMLGADTVTITNVSIRARRLGRAMPTS